MARQMGRETAMGSGFEWATVWVTVLGMVSATASASVSRQSESVSAMRSDLHQRVSERQVANAPLTLHALVFSLDPK